MKEDFCPNCNEHTMKKVTDFDEYFLTSKYRCEQCGLERTGNPETDEVIGYNTALSADAVRALYDETIDDITIRHIPLDDDDVQKLKGCMEFDEKSDHIKAPPRSLLELVKELPQDQWYSIVCDSEGNFVITNEENKDIILDIFCELKKRKGD